MHATNHMHRSLVSALLLLCGSTLLAGCSGRDAELDQFIAATKQEQSSGVQPLPEVKPYESFFYVAQNLRSPFVPGGSGATSAAGVRPDVKRNREFLEQFSLDTLKMVGTFSLGGRVYGLVRTPKDGLVQRVLPGNYIGQNDGKVLEIAPSRISVTEIVPDGLGGYMERPASLALNE
ncbi:MAG: pilus assembly protein PilP [Steroidobacteraceae bacterium]